MEKCVIFDMDGVIIDSEPIHQECEKEMFRMFGITVSPEEHNTLVGATDETIWSRLGSQHDLPVSVEYAVRIKESLYFNRLKGDTSVELIPFVSLLIADLHQQGFLLALASSSPHEQINYILDRFNLRKYFRVIVSGEDVVSGKPHPDIFLKAAELVGVTPASCVVIEDSRNGVEAANKAGMKCIGFLSPHSGLQDLGKAELLVRSFGELSLKTINGLLS